MTATAPRRRRRLGCLLVPLVAILVLAALVVVLVETVGRGLAEEHVAEQVEESLPAGVTADVSVEIGGAFLLGQYLSGRMEDVRLASDDLRVGDVPVPARLRLEGAPVDGAGPIERAQGKVVLDETAVEALLAQQGFAGDASIRDGTLEYADTAPVLGVELDYTITARPSLAGGRLDLVPEAARVSSGPLDLDAGALLDLVAPDGIAVCLAEVLPDTLVLESLELVDGAARLAFSGEDVLLSQEALARTGTCS